MSRQSQEGAQFCETSKKGGQNRTLRKPGASLTAATRTLRLSIGQSELCDWVRGASAMTEARLQGKVVLVTGASRGGGRGIARVLGEEGATVYVTGRSVRGEPTTLGVPARSTTP